MKHYRGRSPRFRLCAGDPDPGLAAHFLSAADAHYSPVAMNHLDNAHDSLRALRVAPLVDAVKMMHGRQRLVDDPVPVREHGLRPFAVLDPIDGVVERIVVPGG